LKTGVRHNPSMMAIQLESDEQLVELLQTILERLHNDGVNSEQFIHQDFSDEIVELFNRLMRRAYQKFGLDQSIGGFTFWGIMESLLMHGYEKWVGKPDRESAIRLLKAFSANLERESKPKVVIVPVRNTIVENPVKLAPFFLIPPQENEAVFVESLKSLAVKAQPIREGLFQHMERTTGYNLTHRPLVLMETTRDEYQLQREFENAFVNQLLPLLRVFDRQFPTEGRSPNLEFMSALMSEHVFSAVVFELEEGEMRRQGLDRMGGELRTGLSLSAERMKVFDDQGFRKIFKWLQRGEGSLSDRVRNSLVFFNRACDAEIEREELSAFLFAVIALESLFSRDPGTPLRATLADSVALLTESKVERRIATARRLRKIYDRRSEIVHAGRHKVNGDDLRHSMQFCARSLFEILTMASTWDSVADAALFEEIDRRKFG
jgi:Apea-like HEPN